MYSFDFGKHPQISTVRWATLALLIALSVAGYAGQPRAGGFMQSPHSDLLRVNQQFQAVPVLAQRAENPAATLLYGSYIGGNGVDYGKDVAVDAAGKIDVLGQTFSDTLFGEDIERAGYSDIFVAKFDPTGGELLYSVVIGGKDSEAPVDCR